MTRDMMWSFLLFHPLSMGHGICHGSYKHCLATLVPQHIRTNLVLATPAASFSHHSQSTMQVVKNSFASEPSDAHQAYPEVRTSPAPLYHLEHCVFILQ